MKTIIDLYEKLYKKLNEMPASFDGANKGESDKFKGYFHRGGGYYSASKDGEITHKSEKGAKGLKKITGKEKELVNKKAAKSSEKELPTTPPKGSKDGAVDNRKDSQKKAEPKKLSGSDLQTGAEKGKERKDDTTKLKSLMPGGDFSRRPLDTLGAEELGQITTKIDDLARMGKEAKEKGEKAPNYNLCQVSIPGTNLYCQGNKGVPRAEMPQFKGTPEPGSPAEKLPKDKNGEVDTEEFFKQMLEKDGVKVSEPTQVPPDRLRSTQSELVGVKVAGMSQVLDAGPDHPAYEAITAPIYVSNDGYVLDGHHRWAAVVAHNAANPDNQIPMNVRVIDEPIEPLVKRSNKFAEEIGIKPKAADTGAAGGPSPITKEARLYRKFR